jgi:hypothetical protein
LPQIYQRHSIQRKHEPGEDCSAYVPAILQLWLVRNIGWAFRYTPRCKVCEEFHGRKFVTVMSVVNKISNVRIAVVSVFAGFVFPLLDRREYWSTKIGCPITTLVSFTLPSGPMPALSPRLIG